MPNHDIVVVGGSAGALEAIYELTEGLPADFPGSVFITLHVPPYSRSQLPALLSRRGRLPAAYPQDGEPIEPGRVYMAPPDYHLLVGKGVVHITQGPRENNCRPAIDPLFRTAAVAYGPRVVGVLLSGLLDDGAVGLQAIRSCGGVTVVQDPNEAPYPDMPANALAETRVDHTLAVAQIAGLLVRLSREPARATKVDAADALKWEAAVAEWDLPALDSPTRPGKPSPFTCPHCKGSLWEANDENGHRFRCRIGHSWSGLALLAGQAEAVDDALNEAFRALKEKQHLSQRLAKKARTQGNADAATHHEGEAERLGASAKNIWEMLMRPQQGPQDQSA
jgi:two-component system chemotaxis response regulator CheB